MSKKVKTAIILAKLSSKEQEYGYSIETQKQKLTEYCQRKNLAIIKIFEIIQSSSKSDHRQFKEMIKFIKNHKETLAIVVDKIDCIQRGILEIPLLETHIKADKIELHFNTEDYVINNNSQSHGKLKWGINALMAQSYVDSLKGNAKNLARKVR